MVVGQLEHHVDRLGTSMGTVVVHIEREQVVVVDDELHLAGRR